MSFVSKVLMFLDPTNYCVLDKKIFKLRNPEFIKSLSVYHLAQMRIKSGFLIIIKMFTTIIEKNVDKSVPGIFKMHIELQMLKEDFSL